MKITGKLIALSKGHVEYFLHFMNAIPQSNAHLLMNAGQKQLRFRACLISGIADNSCYHAKFSISGFAF